VNRPFCFLICHCEERNVGTPKGSKVKRHGNLFLLSFFCLFFSNRILHLITVNLSLLARSHHDLPQIFPLSLYPSFHLYFYVFFFFSQPTTYHPTPFLFHRKPRSVGLPCPLQMQCSQWHDVVPRTGWDYSTHDERG